MGFKHFQFIGDSKAEDLAILVSESTPSGWEGRGAYNVIGDTWSFVIFILGYLLVN